MRSSGLILASSWKFKGNNNMQIHTSGASIIILALLSYIFYNSSFFFIFFSLFSNTVFPMHAPVSMPRNKCERASSVLQRLNGRKKEAWDLSLSSAPSYDFLRKSNLNIYIYLFIYLGLLHGSLYFICTKAL